MVVLKNKALLSITLAVLMATGLSLAALLVAAVVPAGAAFPGTNGKIAFASNRMNMAAADFDIYTLTQGGGASRVLPVGTDIDVQPNWSPGGNQIAFARGNAAATDFDIYTVNADGTQLTQRTTGGAVDKNPAFSRDGNQIAFERGNNIWKHTLAGGTDQVTSGGADTDPNWSPTGNKIAFERGNDIYTVNADGTNTTPVASGPGAAVNRDPNWSPDGNKIAFASNRMNMAATDFDIYTLTLTGGTDQVTSGTAVDSDPAYSPDGARIAFQRGADINLVDANPPYGNLNPLPGENAAMNDDVSPDWGPVPGSGPGPGPGPGGCTINGTSGNDNNLVGTSGPDVICGLEGNDTLKGLQGNDTLRGGRGRDSLDTQDSVNGNDTAKGGKGSDTCTTDPGDTKFSC